MMKRWNAHNFLSSSVSHTYFFKKKSNTNILKFKCYSQKRFVRPPSHPARKVLSSPLLEPSPSPLALSRPLERNPPPPLGTDLLTSSPLVLKTQAHLQKHKFQNTILTIFRESLTSRHDTANVGERVTKFCSIKNSRSRHYLVREQIAFLLSWIHSTS